MTGAVTTISEKLSDRYTRILSRILRLALPVCRPTAANRLSAERVRLYGESAPLLVVDGLPVEGSIEDLNPYDIASVNVLKDAAASAIYGARAATESLLLNNQECP